MLAKTKVCASGMIYYLGKKLILLANYLIDFLLAK